MQAACWPCMTAPSTQEATGEQGGAQLSTLKRVVEQTLSDPRHASYHAAYADALWKQSSTGSR